VEFVTEFIQFTSLEPSIYRLKENLNLLKNELWLSSVRTEVRLVRTVFCDRLQNSANLFITGIRPDGLAERLDSLRYKSFPRSNESSEYSEELDSVRTCCYVIRTTC
jgi:hypothetical protein